MRELPRITIGPSIYDHIRSGGGERLPDEDKVMTGVRWVPGAMDGAFGHHVGGGASAEKAAEVAQLLERAAARPSARNLGKLYDAVEKDDSALAVVDPLVEELVRLDVDRASLNAVGRWLATTAVDRGPVKIGIAVLGVTGGEEDHDLLRTLGSHEEFSLYVAVALRNSSDSPDSELWALARASEGWGRIQCVERLRDTQDPAIRDWILREGFRNSIMYEYLAYIAATTGGLLEALRGDVDRELLTAAGEIVEALVRGGPAEDMDDYADGADAVEAYLGLMRDRAKTLGDFHAVSNVQWFLRTDANWDARAHRGWTAARREALDAACTEILGREEWDGRIAVDLLSDDQTEFWRAQQAAARRGIDTFDVIVAKIREDPFSGHWYQAWEVAGADRAEQLADLARELLPLDTVATGPSEAVGIGPGFEAHSALGWSLQAIRSHIGVGADLVVVGLQSPSIQNRNMALRALEAWPRFAWPAEAADLVRALAASDPAPKTREAAAELVRVRLDHL